MWDNKIYSQSICLVDWPIDWLIPVFTVELNNICNEEHLLTVEPVRG